MFLVGLVDYARRRLAQRAGSVALALAAALLSFTAHAATCAGVSPWDPGKTYASPGNLVTRQGSLFENKWWTLGEDPLRSGQWDVWANKGECDAVTATPAATTVDPHEACRPEGLAVPVVAGVPYCLAYDEQGNERLANGLKRRSIGYFAGWRTGYDGLQRHIATDIPWAHLTHVNYAFAHIGGDNRLSVNEEAPGNEATDTEWPGVAGAAMDPAYPYKGHFNLLNKFRKSYPNLRTLVSVGGWAETGGYYRADGVRVASGGFYAMTTNADGTVNGAGIATFADSAVAFLRKYGFDGVDIDYEFPTTMPQSGNPLDWAIASQRVRGLQAGYRELLRVLRARLDAASAQDGRYYLLTAALPASSYLLRGMENLRALRYLDFANVMSYDLHGTWNDFVGPHAPLFDDGKDAELAAANVYGDAQYRGIGTLNADWAYHYYRGALPPGRINIGVPYYTRGWRNVSGGDRGLWGRAIASACAPGATPPCNIGASGIDNLWYGVDENGNIVATGANPMWHAKNLERGIAGDYLPAYFLGAGDLTGTYARHFDATLVAPWLWNEQKKVFLTTEDEQSVQAKANWVIAKGIGGVMSWELAGDFDWDPDRTALDGSRGQFVPGSTLTRLVADAFRNAAPASTRLATESMPAEAVDLSVELTGYAIGERNFPISPTLRIVNNTGLTIPKGAILRFQYPTSAPDNWIGSSMKVTSGHAGNNVGGLRGDFHTVDYTLPRLAPGAAKDLKVTYRLPIAGPANFRLVVDGKSFSLRQEYPKLPAGAF